MTKRIVIAGAGGFGRGVYGWLASSSRHREVDGIAEVVFIDDHEPAVAPRGPIIGTILDYQPIAGDEVICALGDPHLRRTVVDQMRQRGAKFHTFVDDRAVVGDGVQIGVGAVLCPGVVVSANAVIGRHVHINFNCSVGHDTVLGDFTTLSPSVNVMGEVLVGEEAFFGGSAAVLPRLSIGRRATVGAGSVVVHSVDDDSTVVGNPARRLGAIGANL